VDLGLREKRSLVLGAGGGLGKSVALSLAAEGARVVVAGRTLEKCQQTVREIVSAGGWAVPLEWDFSNLSLVAERHGQACDLLGGHVQILFNNGGGPPPGGAAGHSLSVWEDQFKKMVAPIISITDAVLPAMLQARWGRILTNASSGVVSPIPNLAFSNSLRSALVGWSKTLASEVGSKGVTVNMVLPGRIATERLAFLDQARATREGIGVAEVEHRSRATIPLGRYGDPREYGDAVAFLASERASYITGSMMRIDGGAISSI